MLTEFEGYKALSVTGTASQLNPGTTYSAYDTNGNLSSVSEPNNTADNRSFINDLNGQVLQTTQGDHVERELIVNGEMPPPSSAAEP